MNAQSTAERGYREHASVTRSTRRTEYEVVAQITHRLREAARRHKSDFPGYVTALDDNRKLWQAFGIDVAHENNALPDEVKARILYLAEFTNEHTRKILRENASVVPLLEINVAVMRGLKNEGGEK